jgi:hypothetical protein
MWHGRAHGRAGIGGSRRNRQGHGWLAVSAAPSAVAAVVIVALGLPRRVAATAESRFPGGPGKAFRSALGTLVVCSALALAGTPAVARAQGTAPSSCAQPAVGQVSCAALAAPGSTAVTAAALQAAGTAPAGLSPANLRAAYSLPSSGGEGQTVAVVTPYDDPNAETDVNTYRGEYGIPACSTGCFTKVDATGGTNYPATGPAGWSLATAEELDMISAVCPDCRILLVEADVPQIPPVTTGATTETGVGQAENEAVALGARFVVNTFFGPEVSGETSWDSAYFDHLGVAITAPDGNGSGYGTSYPAASPDVIAVGGTALTADPGTPRGWAETAWAGTGSGCSAYEPKPSWQTDTGCTGRMLNDVSADASPDSGSSIAFYDTASGGWVNAGGNTAAAAIIGAVYALAGTPATYDYPAQYLYANAGGLYDITGGSNGTCSIGYFCTAGPGYDGPTGLGTPDGVSAFLSSYYQPITPTRFLDTRNGTGGTTGLVKAGGTVKLQIAGVNGIPSANVTAVAINITVTGESGTGAIVAYPDGTAVPGTSNLDFAANTDVANLAIVPVGADGAVDLYNAGWGHTTELVGDVSGYFTSDLTAAGDTTYMPVGPIRVLDTRSGIGAPKAKLASGGTLALQIGGANGIPAGVAAVAINLTAADESGSGFLTGYADGTATPATSGLAFRTAAIAGMAIVPVGADGKIDIHASGASTDVVGDVSGYFTAGTADESYRALPLTRLPSKAVAADGTLAVTPGSTIIAPQQTPVANITAVGGSSSGFLAVYPAGISRPGTSTVDYSKGQTIANLAIAATGDGTADIYNDSSGTIEVVVDLFGYFSTG